MADRQSAAEVRRLHEILRQRHAELREAEPGTSEYDRLRALVLSATDDLVGHEESHDRRAIRFAVRAACTLAGVLTAVAVMLMLAGTTTWWYVLPALAVAAVTAVLGVAEQKPHAALLTAAAAALLLAAALGLVPSWTLTVLPPVLGAALVLHAREAA